MADISFHLTGDALWQRMERAVEKIHERLERTTRVLEQAGVPYAIIGGNAVRAWVAQADETRNAHRFNSRAGCDRIREYRKSSNADTRCTGQNEAECVSR
jgi:hypothetical protein